MNMGGSDLTSYKDATATPSVTSDDLKKIGMEPRLLAIEIHRPLEPPVHRLPAPQQRAVDLHVLPLRVGHRDDPPVPQWQTVSRHEPQPLMTHVPRVQDPRLALRRVAEQPKLGRHAIRAALPLASARPGSAGR